MSGNRESFHEPIPSQIYDLWHDNKKSSSASSLWGLGRSHRSSWSCWSRMRSSNGSLASHRRSASQWPVWNWGQISLWIFVFECERHIKMYPRSCSPPRSPYTEAYPAIFDIIGLGCMLSIFYARYRPLSGHLAFTVFPGWWAEGRHKSETPLGDNTWQRSFPDS